MRETPQSEEAEKGFIGSLLQPEAAAPLLAEHGDRLTPEHFHHPGRRLIYEAIHQMNEERQPIDLPLVTQRLIDAGTLLTVGGAQELTALLLYVPTAANATYYVDIMRAKFIRREMIRVGTEMVRAAYEENIDESALLDEGQKAVTGLALETSTRPALRHIAAGVEATVERLIEAFKHRGQETLTGYATGLIDIDRRTAGFRKQQLIVIGARTSQGKSAFSLNIAAHLAKGQKGQDREGNERWLVPPMPVAFYSLEMSYDELAERYTCSGLGISLQRLKDGYMDREEVAELPARGAKLAEGPLYIDDTPGLSIENFKARARRAAVTQRVGLIVVDFIQEMRSPTKRGIENRALELGEIASGLKAIAKELNIPVIVCSQLSRETEKRALSRPKLSDLRESGRIEEAADVVMLLWRPEKSCDTDKDRIDLAKKLGLEGANDAETIAMVKAYAEVNLAKVRNGATGAIKLRFQDDLTQFQSIRIRQGELKEATKQWSGKEEDRE